MERFDAFNELWGGIVQDIVLDICNHTLKMAIEIVQSSKVEAHTLDCIGVSEFEFHNSISGTWKYAELTELHADRVESGGIRLEFTLWSEDARVVVIADSVLLDMKVISPY